MIVAVDYQPTTEREILYAIRKALGRESDLTLWRLSQGRAEYRVSSGTTRSAQHGLANGAADLIGILTLCAACYAQDNPETHVMIGRFFALEVKGARGIVGKEQKLWGELVRKRGGFYAVVRSVTEAREALARARTGAGE